MPSFFRHRKCPTTLQGCVNLNPTKTDWPHSPHPLLLGSAAQTNPAYTLADAHLGYRIGAWTVALYGKNLLDNAYFTASSGPVVVPAAPRTWGLRAAVRF